MSMRWFTLGRQEQEECVNIIAEWVKSDSLSSSTTGTLYLGLFAWKSESRAMVRVREQRLSLEEKVIR